MSCIFVTCLACPEKGDPIPATYGPGLSPGMGQSREVAILGSLWLACTSSSEGHPAENTFTPGSVVLGTFRKLALRASDIRNV